MKALLGILVASAVSLAPVHMVQAQEAASRPEHTMSIAGVGVYWAAPEVAKFSAEIITRGSTLAEARDSHPELAAKVRGVIDGLASLGLDLQSAQYSMSEEFPLHYNPSATQEEQNTSQFVAKTRYMLSTENLTGLTDIIAALANEDLRIDTISYSVKDERAPLIEARKAAARDAQEQASAYAEALNLDLVEIRSLADGSAMPYAYGEADLALQQQDGSRPPITIDVPTMLRYGASVTVDWTIAPKGP